MLSLFNAQTRGIHAPNLVVGMACFCGGLGQLLAGMWEFPRGNTFGGAGEFLRLSIHSSHLSDARPRLDSRRVYVDVILNESRRTVPRVLARCSFVSTR